MKQSSFVFLVKNFSKGVLINLPLLHPNSLLVSRNWSFYCIFDKFSVQPTDFFLQQTTSKSNSFYVFPRMSDKENEPRSSKKRRNIVRESAPNL